MAFVRGHYRRTSSGVTYVRPHRRRLTPASNGLALPALPAFLALLALPAVALITWLFVLVFKVVAAHLVGIAVAVGIVLGGLFLGTLLVVTTRRIRRQRVDRYLDLCRDFIQHGSSVNPATLEMLDKVALQVPSDDQARLLGEASLYRDLTADVLADGMVDEDETQLLRALEERFALDPQRTSEIMESVFLGLLPALGEGFFDKDQEARLCAAAAGLGLSEEFVQRHISPLVSWRDSLIQAEVRKAERLAVNEQFVAERVAEAERFEAERQRAREKEYEVASAVRESAVREELATSIATRLTKNEVAWFQSPAVQVERLKKREKRSEGQLLVTNRRVLFVSDGATTLALSKILDASADLDSGILRLIKDGRKRPFDFEMLSPLVAMAHVDRSLREL